MSAPLPRFKSGLGSAAKDLVTVYGPHSGRCKYGGYFGLSATSWKSPNLVWPRGQETLLALGVNDRSAGNRLNLRAESHAETECPIRIRFLRRLQSAIENLG